jgi:serine phosphatase RsbU (regulator of sigma subunit)
VRIDLAVLKVAKYGVSTGGDTVEVSERPSGGISAVIVDGQGTGAPAKSISSSVATKAVSLIGDGVRDGAAARAVNDYLYAYRRGRVQASLAIVSADIAESRLILSRNTPCPGIFLHASGVEVDDSEASVIGLHRLARPRVRHHPLEAGAAVVTFSDGVFQAGRARGESLGMAGIVSLLERDWAEGAEAMAAGLLEAALQADRGRAADDMAVVALKVEPGEDSGGVREMLMRYPLPAVRGGG